MSIKYALQVLLGMGLYWGMKYEFPDTSIALRAGVLFGAFTVIWLLLKAFERR